MAIALVGSRTLFNVETGADPHALSYTVASGATLLLVKIGWEDSTVTTVTEVRWGGSGGALLTEAVFQTNAGANRHAGIYYLINPTVQTADIWIDLPGSVEITVEALALSGTDTTSPIADFDGGQITGTAVTTAAALVPVGSDNLLETIITSGSHTAALTPQGTASETNEATNTGGFGGGFDVAFSTEAGISANVTPGWDSSASVVLSMAAILVKPAAGAVNATVEPSTGSLALTGHAPTFAVSIAAAPGVGTLALTGFAPTATAQAAVTTALGAIELVGLAPTVSAEASATVEPAAGAVEVTALAPAVAASAVLIPAASSIEITGQAAAFAASALTEPAAGAVELTALAPDVTATAAVTADLGSIEVTGFAPTVTTEAGATVTPAAGAVELEGLAPTVSSGAVLEPPASAVEITGLAPTWNAHVDAQPSLGELEIAGLAPAAFGGTNELLAPDEILAASNLQDTNLISPPVRLADIDEPVDSDDGEWWTLVGTVDDTEASLAFPPSSGPLSGPQKLRVRVRKTTGAATPQVRIELWYVGGIAPIAQITTDVTSDVGQVVELAFNADDLPDQDGDGVQIKFFGLAA